MLDLNPINERLGLAATHEWTMVENNWSTTTIYSGDSSICTLRLDEEFEEDEDLETYIEDQRNTAIFITNAPTDLRACIDEIERLRILNQKCYKFARDIATKKEGWAAQRALSLCAEIDESNQG